jgi:hypothetical protein
MINLNNIRLDGEKARLKNENKVLRLALKLAIIKGNIYANGFKKLTSGIDINLIGDNEIPDSVNPLSEDKIIKEARKAI